MSKIRLLIVDDQYLFAESLETVLTLRTDHFDVAGIAGNGREALEWVRTNNVDIILMDVRMPVMDGVEATRLIKTEQPEVKIVMLTTFRDDEYVYQALKYGAAGYILKNTPIEDLITTIEAAYHGLVQISPDLIPSLVAHYRADLGVSEGTGSGDRPVWISYLTAREKEILQLMAEGLDNTRIAGKLFLAPQTVKNHVSQIYSKIGTKDRMEALRLVRDLGRDLRLL
jgi:DNA-binding NarL/FixJ family response regulator